MRSGLRAAIAGAVVVGCAGQGGPTPPAAGLRCSIPNQQIFDGGVARGGIPDLLDPPLVGADHPEAAYLLDEDRVLGLIADGQAIAVPHNILWWHEVANFGFPDGRVAVTYCPLTGSAVAFDLEAARIARFLVSGLLFRSNLIMVDEETESLWPQMTLGASCGPRLGAGLETRSLLELRWDAWRKLHPDTKVVSGSLGFSRDYTRYPYGTYEALNNDEVIFPVPRIDTRRPPKERLVGIPHGEGGIAFPFLELEFAADDAGGVAVAAASAAGEPVVVFWSTPAEGAGAYRPVAAGQPLTFEASAGVIRDLETGSRWGIDGRSVEGPLAGARLDPVPRAYVAFWFAWALFQPDTEIWSRGG